MQAVEDKETYNGWANYPTWAVNLWLQNDEGLYNATLDVVRNSRITIAKEHVDLELASRAPVADAIRAFVEDIGPNLQAGFAADLLGYALDQVNWYEIADAWIEMAQDQ